MTQMSCLPPLQVTQGCKRQPGPAKQMTTCHRLHASANIQGSTYRRAATSAQHLAGEPTQLMLMGKKRSEGGWGGFCQSASVCNAGNLPQSSPIYFPSKEKKKQQPVILHKFAARPQVQASDLLLTRRLGCPNTDAEGEF